MWGGLSDLSGGRILGKLRALLHHKGQRKPTMQTPLFYPKTKRDTCITPQVRTYMHIVFIAHRDMKMWGQAHVGSKDDGKA